MRADNSFETTGHNRIIHITGIPYDLTELTIQITYVNKDNAGAIGKAIALDTHVIPAIIKAINGESDIKKATTKPAWSARCDCYNGHASSSGRCTCRNSGDSKNHGVIDPTRYEMEVAICEECRENCPVGKGTRSQL